MTGPTETLIAKWQERIGPTVERAIVARDEFMANGGEQIWRDSTDERRAELAAAWAPLCDIQDRINQMHATMALITQHAVYITPRETCANPQDPSS